MVNLIKAIAGSISAIFPPRQEVCTDHKFVLSCVVGDEFDGFDKLVVCDYCGQEAIQHANGKFELIDEEGDGDGE